MLTRSPSVPSRSANSSPSFHGFHYAPAVSPHQSPSRVPIAAPRRRSTPSPATPPNAPPRAQSRQPQPPPTTTMTLTAPAAAPPPAAQMAAPPVRTPVGPPPTPPGPAPLDTASAQSIGAGAQPPAAVAAPSESRQQQKSAEVVSPAKRRSSPSALSTPQASATAPKRTRSAAGPPKVLPQRYELCSVEDIVVLIAQMLGELIETNDPLALEAGNLTRFHSRTAPGISVLDYLHRLAKHATLTPPLLLAMVYYIDRLCALYPDFTINTLTVHRFLITAATVAAKGLSDSFWNNSTYARVGGVKLAELKLLELEFLYRVDWKIVPNPEVLVAYYNGLVERAPGYILEGETEGDSQDNEDVENDEGDSDDIGDDDDLITDEPQPPPPVPATTVAQASSE